MVVVKRRHELDFGCNWGIYSILVWSCPYTSISVLHRIYAAYGGVFIVMALLWGFIFEGVSPDFYDTLGASIAIIGVIIIYYTPRKGEKGLWTDR